MSTLAAASVEFEYSSDNTRVVAGMVLQKVRAKNLAVSGVYLVESEASSQALVVTIKTDAALGVLSGDEYLRGSDFVAVTNPSQADSMSSAADIVRRLWKGKVLSPDNSSQVSKIKSTLASLRILCRNGDVDAAVDRCFEVIENAFAQRDLDSIEELLEGAEPNELDPRVTIGMLRASFRAREKFSVWSNLLIKERARLQREGRNEKRMLRGLQPVNASATISSQTFA